MKSFTALAAAVFLSTGSVFGLCPEDLSEPTPPPEPRSPARVVSEEDSTRGAVRASEDQELLTSLRGIAIATTTEAALKLQSQIDQGVRVAGLTDTEQQALVKIAAAELGKPVSLRSLDRLATALEEEFRSRSQRFMRISFPPQEITSGIIAIRVAAARAGKVALSGKPAFGIGFAATGFRTRPGDVISDDTVLDDLAWLNENPLRQASVAFSDGAVDDTLDLRLRVKSPKVWRAYGGIDNQLSESLGDERLFLGIQYGDVFHLDHRLTAQYTSALEFNRLQGFSSIYEIPLPMRHLLSLSVGYTESESDVAGPLDQSGKFSRVALGYAVPLPRWNGIGHEWRAGIEFRNNDYLFPNNTSADVRFFQLETGWKGRRTDRFGSTRLDLSLNYSPGHGFFGSEDADYIALGGSGAQALIARFEAERILKLDDYGFLTGRLRGQWSDADLLSSDQIAAAGAARVRGFDEIVGYASNGLVGTLEAQSRPFSAARVGEFSGLVFLDGAVLERDAPADAGELSSTGVGVRWRRGEHFSAKVDLGIPLSYPDSENGNPVLHFSISTTW